MSPMEMFPLLTRSRCDCCNGEFTDPVGDLVIWDAVYAYRAELRHRQSELEATQARVQAIANRVLEGGTP